jgi:formylglycine-generating enzyme required for sulfatase activity
MNGGIDPLEHIVALSPFYLGAHEVSVAEFRTRSVPSAQYVTWSGSLAGTSAADWCTYTSSPGPHESLPVSCVSWLGARQYCQAAGGDLPTEAQFEYVLGGLQSNAFVWGTDEPDCDDAVWGRGDPQNVGESVACLPQAGSGASPQDLLGYPLAVDRASAGRDVLTLPGGSLRDLAGNLTEWALDYEQQPTGSCWSAPGVYQNPVCQSPSTALTGARAAKGGNFTAPQPGLLASMRFAIQPDEVGSMTGFRCARPAGGG